MSTARNPKTTLLLVFFLAVTAVAGAISARYLLDTQTALPDDITLLEPARSIPDLALIDDTGAPFTLAQLRGGWSLLFFGFTHCPDICPNTLVILNAVHAQLKQSENVATPRIIFVSVDPQRDTPQKMQDYVQYFDDSFVGVTGEITQIKKLTSALYLPFDHIENDDGSTTVEHSAALVLVNPQGRARAYLTPPHAPQKLADDIRKIIAAG